MGVRVEGGREGTLEVARKVNHYQAKIKETTRKMMALVSELSMQQVRQRMCKCEGRCCEWSELGKLSNVCVVFMLLAYLNPNPLLRPQPSVSSRR